VLAPPMSGSPPAAALGNVGDPREAFPVQLIRRSAPRLHPHFPSVRRQFMRVLLSTK
jgi:hypothetical protein